MTETAVGSPALKANPESKSQQAYAAVKARIVEGTYTPPGYRLVLAKIAEDLGFSVVPVREAIRRLEAEGWSSSSGTWAPRWPESTPPNTCTRCRP